jgi:hypothetical protein
MFRKLILSSAALALVATAAYAAPKVSMSSDNRVVSVMPGNGSLNVANGIKTPGAAYSTIATKYPNSLYFCCYGNTVSGPSSIFGVAYGVAEQVILAKKTKVKHLYAGVGFVSGNGSVSLTLYNDSSNNVGTAVSGGSGSGTTSTTFGSCCGLVDAPISPVVTLNAGTYWVGITTDDANFEAANFETVDEVNPGYTAGTSTGGSTWGGGYQTTTRPAVAVN